MTESGLRITSSANKYIQYRATLSSTVSGRTPRLAKLNEYITKFSFTPQWTETELPAIWRSKKFNCGARDRQKRFRYFAIDCDPNEGTLEVMWSVDDGRVTGSYQIDTKEGVAKFPLPASCRGYHIQFAFIHNALSKAVIRGFKFSYEVLETRV